MNRLKCAILGAALLLTACAVPTRPDPSPAPSREQATPQPPPAGTSPIPAGNEVQIPATAVVPAPSDPPLVPMPPPAVEPAAAQKPPAAAKPPQPPKPPVAAKSPGPARAPAAPAIAADATAPAGVTISGSLELSAGLGQTVSADDMARAAVYFVADAGGVRPRPGRYTIYTHNKQFEPESLVVPLGSTIAFPNQDEILHNVFSVTPASSFDLGIYGEGKSAEYTFNKAGLVLINCNVHHAMQANVLVIDTPYFARPAADGRFELSGLPAGPGKLMVWHPRAAIRTELLTVPSSGPLSLRLALTKPRISEHLNKERKPYPAAAR